jgi:hypothetical protein
MHRNRCPETFWRYGLSYTNEIRQLLARPSLDWRSPLEVLTGETLDSSEYINFDSMAGLNTRTPIQLWQMMYPLADC